MGDLTDEQFRAARSEMVARLRHRASVARDVALEAVRNATDRPHNPFSIGAIGSRIEQANGWSRAASLVEMMEREGFDWSEV